MRLRSLPGKLSIHFKLFNSRHGHAGETRQVGAGSPKPARPTWSHVHAGMMCGPTSATVRRIQVYEASRATPRAFGEPRVFHVKRSAVAVLSWSSGCGSRRAFARQRSKKRQPAQAPARRSRRRDSRDLMSGSQSPTKRKDNVYRRRHASSSHPLAASTQGNVGKPSEFANLPRRSLLFAFSQPCQAIRSNGDQWEMRPVSRDDCGCSSIWRGSSGWKARAYDRLYPQF